MKQIKINTPTKPMKTAEDWTKEMGYKYTDDINPHIQLVSGADLLYFVKQIQLDAYKQGCTDAANEVALHWNDYHQQTNQYEQSHRSAKAILTLRDNKTI